MTYNTTALLDSTSISGLAIAANEATNEYLFGLLVVALWFIITFRLKGVSDFDHAALISSFVCAMLSTLLAYGGFVIYFLPLGFFLATALLAWYVFAMRKD